MKTVEFHIITSFLPRSKACVCVSAALRPMDGDLCLGIPPNTTQLCHISCPVECEVSAWSAWGPCTYENCQDQAAKKGTVRIRCHCDME